MKIKLSASGIKTFLDCQPSASDDVGVRISEYKDASEHGIMVHKYIEHLYAGHSREEAISMMPDGNRIFCNAIDIFSLPSLENGRCEVAYEYDATSRKAKEITIAGPREYPWRDGCIYGTADVVTAAFDIWDIKTGNSPVDDPASNAQLYFFAMCMKACYGPRPNYGVGIVFVHDDGSIDLVERRIALSQILSFEERLVSAFLNPQTKENMNYGCVWCSKKLSCTTLSTARTVYDIDPNDSRISGTHKLAMSRTFKAHADALRDNTRDSGDTMLTRATEVSNWCDILCVAKEQGLIDASLLVQVPGVAPIKGLPPELANELRNRGMVKMRKSLKSVSNK